MTKHNKALRAFIAPGLFHQLVTLLLLSANLLRPSISGAQVIAISEQGSGSIGVIVNNQTDAKEWRNSLARYFSKETSWLSDFRAIKRKNGQTWVRLDDVLPAWMNFWAMKNAPASTNCYSNAFFLAGGLSQPFGMDWVNSWPVSRGVPLLSSWVEDGNASIIQYSDFPAKLSIGDAISVSSINGNIDGEHVFTWLGEGLIFEQNSKDRPLLYRFGVTDTDFLPRVELGGSTKKPYSVDNLNPPVALRVLKPKYSSEIVNMWRDRESEAFEAYSRAQTELARVWFQGVSLKRPDDIGAMNFQSAYRYCRGRWLEMRDRRRPYNSPMDDFYAFCFSTLNTYSSYFGYRGESDLFDTDL